MRRALLLCAAFAGLLVSASGQSPAWDTYSDTWAGVDALGRVIPMFDRAGPARQDKTLGMFYFLTFDHGGPGPLDNTKILAAHPDALKNVNDPAWGPMHSSHYWGEPLLGYYTSDDEWVLRKHAQMLANAGVDVVVFDNSNAVTYDTARNTLCRVWESMRKQGLKTPHVAFLCPFGNPSDIGTHTLSELYNTLYKPGLYSDLWFQWNGKPLVLAQPSYAATPEISKFFTFRSPIGPYDDKHPQPGWWAWLQNYPQATQLDPFRKPEQMTVGVAQNYSDATGLSAMSIPGAYGRSFHDGHEHVYPGSVNLGLNFQEQWERALVASPPFVFVTGWNEWTAMIFDEWYKYKAPPAIFVDEFNQEFSRDIEPMVGGHGDDYYYQLVDNVRLYKGVRPLPPIHPTPISIDGSFDDWKAVTPEYRDAVGDTVHRDVEGVGHAGRYVNTTGRNDIVAAKVSYDADNVYFYVRSQDPLTSHTDPDWMLLYINTNADYKKGWLGYDFVVNRRVGDDATSLEKNIGGGYNWESVANVRYAAKGNEIEIAVPRSALGLGHLPATIDFKWADHCFQKGDWTDFTLNGDAAPDDRFNYRAILN